MLTRAGPIIGATGAARLGDAADLGGSEGTQGVAAGSRRRVPLSGRPAAGAELDLLLVLGWGALANLALFFGLIAGCVGAHKGRSGAIWFILGLFCGPVALIAHLTVPSREPPWPDCRVVETVEQPVDPDQRA